MIDINDLVIDRNSMELTGKCRFKTGETDYIIGEQEGLCINCKKPTRFVDIYSEAHICCENCEKEFYKKFHEWEKAAEEHFEEDI